MIFNDKLPYQPPFLYCKLNHDIVCSTSWNTVVGLPISLGMFFPCLLSAHLYCVPKATMIRGKITEFTFPFSALPAFAVRAPNGTNCVRTSFDVRCSCWRSFAFPFLLCQHSLFAHQTVRTASVLRLTYAAHADEALLSPFSFLLNMEICGLC